MAMGDIHDRLIGFVGGNTMTMLSGVVTGAEIGKVVILGLIGGVVGMLGKDIYQQIKKNLWEK
jgi:hypothetical protein